uniref:Uncharacterized protein n=1 Tax=Pseudictyota dubia TaxID=2749911 RepID=A0A7R9W0Q0_9STRA|mmetsp:Transcript_28115/g.52370  ORF Transcript_28115/g.52370 Transcript_28115/m.52370 type:complete len:130 (+) Transcript_28115:323-712(+)
MVESVHRKMDTLYAVDASSSASKCADQRPFGCVSMRWAFRQQSIADSAGGSETAVSSRGARRRSTRCALHVFGGIQNFARQGAEKNGAGCRHAAVVFGRVDGHWQRYWLGETFNRWLRRGRRRPDHRLI